MTELDDPNLSDLYRRASKEEPGHDSDRIILDAARRAVPGARYGAAYRGWALAATLVLGVGIAWQSLLSPPKVDVLAPEPAVESLAEPAGRVEEAGQAKVGAAVTAQPAMKRRELPADRDQAPARPAVQHSRSMAADAVTGQGARSEVATPACSEFWLADDQPAEAWLAAIERARTTGDVYQATCLQTRYRELFAGGRR